VTVAVTVVVEPEALSGAAVTLSGDAYHHLFRVCRLARDQELRLVDGRGAARWGRATRVEADRATVELGAVAPSNEPQLSLELWVAPPRSRRAGWLVEKATEVGVAAIRFVATHRGTRNLSKQGVERLQRVALAAVEQCHRARVPEVTGLHRWEACLERLDSSVAWVLAPGGGSIADAPTVGSMALVVGPEGGWTAEEVSQLAEHGALGVGLGPRVLRVETAAVVGAALALSSL